MLEILVWVSRIGTTSLNLNFEMRRAGESALAAKPETTYLNVDRRTFTKREIAP